MSSHAAIYAWSNAVFPRTDEIRVRVRKKVDFALLERVLLHAGTHEGECFFPLGVQVVFELYRWMVATTWDRARDTHGVPARYPNILSPLSDSSAVGLSAIDPIGAGWRGQMKSRLANMLHNGGSVALWRKDQRLDPKGTKVVPMRVYDSPPDAHGNVWGVGEAGVAKALDRLFTLRSPERRTRAQLNPCHADARRLVGAHLVVRPEGWSFYLDYGVDGSSWTDPELQVDQGPEETFWDFLNRAYLELDAKLTPACTWDKPPHPRGNLCRGGFTGTDAEGKEWIGGVSLDEAAAAIDLAADGFTPVLLPGETVPAQVVYDKWHHRDDRMSYFACERLHPRRDRPLEREHRPAVLLSEEKHRRARARYLLTEQLYGRVFLDLDKPHRSLASQFFFGGHGLNGCAIREEDAAKEHVLAGGDVAFEGWFPRGAQEGCES